MLGEQGRCSKEDVRARTAGNPSVAVWRTSHGSDAGDFTASGFHHLVQRSEALGRTMPVAFLGHCSAILYSRYPLGYSPGLSSTCQPGVIIPQSAITVPDQGHPSLRLPCMHCITNPISGTALHDAGNAGPCFGFPSACQHEAWQG
jgi:hypothetical protein